MAAPLTVRVLVTGAAGFVGQHLCRQLVAQGIAVRALCRETPRTPLLSGVDVRRGDVTDENAVRVATCDVDVVVHLAARVHVMRDTAPDPLAAYRRVNVYGSSVVAAAARDAGVRHIVFASSVKAVGDTSKSTWKIATPAEPTDPYGVSKLEAEQVLLAQSDEQLAVTVLRFPLVYGPGMKGNMLRLFRIIDRGLPVPVGSTENRRSVLYVGNAAAAITRVMGCEANERPASQLSGPFFVADGPARSTAALAQSIAAALGTSARTLPLPTILLRGLAHLGDPITNGRISAILNRLLGSLEIDEHEFERAYDFAPPYTTEAAMDITARWFRHS